MITVNLTTTPARLPYIQPAINSLSKQSIKPDEIRLWLIRGELTEAQKEEAQSFIEKYRVINCYTDNDYGPATKLIAPLEVAQEGDIIVTADDDVIYPENWLESLYNSFTGKSAVGYRGKILDWHSYKGSTCTYAKMNTEVHIITGTWGAIYKAEWFDVEKLKQMIDDNAPESYYCDDIIINAYLKSKGIGRYCIKSESEFKPTEAHSVNALWDINKDADYNHKLIKRLGL